MSFNVLIKEEAHQDTIEAYNYYEKKQSGLGERFLGALSQCYNSLTDHPQHYSLITEDANKVLRDVRLKVFPYVVVFEISGNDVIVYAVHNTYKHPGNKLKKA